MPHIRKAETGEITRQLAEDMVAYLESRLETHSAVYIAVSGGSTPASLFRSLVAQHAGQSLWRRVHVFWVDERCVDQANAESNFGNARPLLVQLGIPEDQLYPMYTEGPVEAACSAYAALMNQIIPKKMGMVPVLDLVLLGLGEDGHTASLFPGVDHDQDTGICSTAQHPVTGQWRITLTLSTINAARKIVFFILGQNKAEVLTRIFSSEAGSQLPGGMIEPSEGDLTWYLDEAAAGVN